MSIKDKKQEKVKEQQEQYDGFDRYEIINNVRYDLKPSPTVNHQQLVTQLWHSIYMTCNQNGVILVAPMDVYFDDENTFQPDLIFIANENSHIIKEARIEGAPDLVAEILSPSTSTNDKIHKKAQYERFEVKEYWIVDPVHFTIDQFVLESGAYVLRRTYGDSDELNSDVISCVSINVDQLFEVIKRN